MFNPIDANYSAGVLTNITTGTGVRLYVNTINYTALAISKSFAFTAFGLPLSSNGIALYTTTLNYTMVASSNPIQFSFNPTIISTNQFRITVIFPYIKINVTGQMTISLLRFSIVVFDTVNIESSYKYSPFLSIDTFNVFSINTNLTILGNFQTQMLLGLIDFMADTANCRLDTNWVPYPASNTILVERSYNTSSPVIMCQLRSQRLSIFYLKAWTCPTAQPYYSLSTKMCNDACPFYTYLNITIEACVKCAEGCYTCSD